MTSTIPHSRRDVIAHRLAEGQAVIASELAIEFNISEDAIRRDLRALASEGLCRRVYGGALPISRIELPMSTRLNIDQPRKKNIAQTALETICYGELLFLDSSSTNFALVEILPEDFDIRVVTNSIDIAAAVLRRQDIPLTVIGGGVDLTVGGCIDAAATLSLKLINIDRCFIGACSVSAIHGVSAFNISDATFKREIINQSRISTVLATNEKFSVQAHYNIYPVSKIDNLIVEHDIPDLYMESLIENGAQVIKSVRSQQ